MYPLLWVWYALHTFVWSHIFLPAVGALLAKLKKRCRATSFTGKGSLFADKYCSSTTGQHIHPYSHSLLNQPTPKRSVSSLLHVMVLCGFSTGTGLADWRDLLLCVIRYDRTNVKGAIRACVWICTPNTREKNMNQLHSLIMKEVCRVWGYKSAFAHWENVTTDGMRARKWLHTIHTMMLD